MEAGETARMSGRSSILPKQPSGAPRATARHRTPSEPRMRLVPSKLVAATLLLAAFAFAGAAEQPLYIHDDLRVDLRSGPGYEYRILDYLPSGTELEVLEERGDWTRVRARGEEGWIQAQYTSNEPIAEVRLAQAEERLARVTEARDRLQSELESLRTQMEELSSRYTQASRRAEQLRSELEALRETASSAIETEAAYESLQREADALRERIATLAAERARLEEDRLIRGIKWGAAAVLAGMLLAWLLTRLSGRETEDRWF